MAHLQSPRSMRRPLHSSLKSSGLGHIKDMVSIHDLRRIAVRGLWLGGVGLERGNEVVGEEVRLRWRPARRVGQRWMLASSVRSTPWSSRVAVTSVRVSVSHGSSAAIASSGLASACASIAASWPSGVVQAASSSLTAARIAVRRAGSARGIGAGEMFVARGTDVHGDGRERASGEPPAPSRRSVSRG